MSACNANPGRSEFIREGVCASEAYASPEKAPSRMNSVLPDRSEPVPAFQFRWQQAVSEPSNLNKKPGIGRVFVNC
jgi:hypothetical protein